MFNKKIENYKIFKKTIRLSVTIFLVASMVFVFFEPVMTKAVDDTISVGASVTSEVTIGTADDVSLLPAIPGVSGGNATGSTSWTVITNNSSGFALKLSSATCSSQNNVLCLDGSNYFTNASTTVAYAWPTPSAGATAFGFTPEPATNADTATAFLDGGASCGAGESYTPDKCWSGFNSSDPTTLITVINRSGPTSSSGEAEVVKFKAQFVSGGAVLESGDYSASVTATVSLNP
ncbi:MAG: hypothetical protein NT094_01100 [Candidatus Staskawiczbacteria bacterium]|nr:hypothetical protein [Candidatus Staskawiczbacteria bacterium]